MEGQQFVPMSATRIIDRVFFFYSKNFLKFAAMISIIFVPIGIISAFLNVTVISSPNQNMSGAEAIIAIVMALGPGLLSMLGTVLCSGILAQGFSELYLGKSLETGEVFGVVLPKLGKMIGAGFVSTLIIILGYFLFIVPGVIFGLWYSMISVVIVLEGSGAMSSLSRSKELTKGNLGKIFGTIFLAGLIAAIINGALTGIVGAIMGGGLAAITDPESVESASTTFLIVQQAMQTIASIITAPITAGAIVLLYYDLRIRKEGFDLEMLAQGMAGQDTAGIDQEVRDFTYDPGRLD